MNVLEFKRWAEGQRIPASLPSFDSVPGASSQRAEETRADAKASDEASSSRAARFLGTLRWGK